MRTTKRVDWFFVQPFNLSCGGVHSGLCKAKLVWPYTKSLEAISLYTKWGPFSARLSASRPLARVLVLIFESEERASK